MKANEDYMMYDGHEVDMAANRFIAASGRSRAAFFNWLGFTTNVLRDYDYPEPSPPMHIYNSVTDKVDKMNAALSPHWFALIKASIAREIRAQDGNKNAKT